MTAPELKAHLNALAVESGMKNIREGCKMFLRQKTDAGLLPEKRRAVPKQWLLNAWARQDGKCGRCGEDLVYREAVADHKIPLARGGKHTQGNICACHARCNLEKSSHTHSEEAKLLGRTVVEIIERQGGLDE